MSQALIQAERFTWRYSGRNENALTDISLTVSPGEVVGLTGPAGAGKSTLLLALAGLIPGNFQGAYAGTVLVGGQPTLGTPLHRLGARVAMVFQDPEAQFLGLTVEEEMAFALEHQGLPDGEIRRRIQASLAVVGLSEFLRRSPFELSGGQKQRVAIAAALAMEPDVLLLDEPTSELDPAGAAGVFAVLDQLRRDRAVAIVVASHQTEALAEVCTRMLALVAGRLVADGPAAAFFGRTQDLLDWGIRPPDVTAVVAALEERGLPLAAGRPVTLPAALTFLRRHLERGQLRWRVSR